MKVRGFIRHSDFKKQFRRLHVGAQKAFEERIFIFMTQPYHIVLNNHPLHGDWKNHWSINITGDIRAVYRIEETIAVFVAIGTHNQLYGE
jgi:addiction module RelE/StbE family toxin